MSSPYVRYVSWEASWKNEDYGKAYKYMRKCGLNFEGPKRLTAVLREK